MDVNKGREAWTWRGFRVSRNRTEREWDAGADVKRQKKMPPQERRHFLAKECSGYASCESSAFLRLRRIATPAAPKPSSIIAQVDGSGRGVRPPVSRMAPLLAVAP